MRKGGGHKVYRKRAHTNLVLKPGSHHQPSSIEFVPATMTHRARALCEREIFHDEVDFINTGTATPTLGPTQLSLQWVPGLSGGVKRLGRGINHPSHLAPRIKKE